MFGTLPRSLAGYKHPRQILRLSTGCGFPCGLPATYGKLPRMAANHDTSSKGRLPMLSPSEERARQVLHITMDLLGFDPGDLAKVVGCSRSNIEGKLNRRSRIRI